MLNLKLVLFFNIEEYCSTDVELILFYEYSKYIDGKINKTCLNETKNMVITTY